MLKLINQPHGSAGRAELCLFFLICHDFYPKGSDAAKSLRSRDQASAHSAPALILLLHVWSCNYRPRDPCWGLCLMLVF